MAQRAELVDIIATQEPEATAIGETVVVTTPVVFGHRQDVGGRVRLTLTIEQAEYLAAQIQPVLVTARAFRRQKTRT